MNNVVHFLFVTFIKWVCCSILILLGLIVSAIIIWRYIIILPLPWADELARYLFIWLTFLGSSAAVGGNAHLGVNLLVKNAPNSIRFILQITIVSLTLAFCCIILIWGISLTSQSMARMAPTLKIPMGYVYIALPVSAFIMIYYLSMEGISLIKDWINRKNGRKAT